MFNAVATYPTVVIYISALYIGTYLVIIFTPTRGKLVNRCFVYRLTRRIARLSRELKREPMCSVRCNAVSDHILNPN